MATLLKLPSGNWRTQVRRKGQYATRTFRKKEDAETWGLAIEREIDLSAIATALREGEIFRIEWQDVDMRNRLITVRDRKAPQLKEGTTKWCPC